MNKIQRLINNNRKRRDAIRPAVGGGTRRADALPLAGTNERCSGFTLIELLVSISIIALLMSLILPAINNAREAARRTECANHLRNLGVAMTGWGAARDRYPLAAYWYRPPGGGAAEPNHNWVVELLPWIDRKDLADRWDKHKRQNDPANAALAVYHVKVLVCPSDLTADGAGDLSYALNGGIGFSMRVGTVHDCPVTPFGTPIDLNGNGQTCLPNDPDDGSPSDRQILSMLGMFFPGNWDTPNGVDRFHRPGSIIDGLSNTLMLTENVRTGYDPSNPVAGWATGDANRTSVYFSHRVCAAERCDAASVDYARANSGDHRINSGKLQAEGEAPWPSSFHPQGVNMVLGDGSLRFVSEEIDGKVYANLFSTQGTRLTGSPLDQGVLSGNDF